VTNLETSKVGGTVDPNQPGSVGQFTVTNPGTNLGPTPPPANFQGTFAGGVLNSPNGFASPYGIGVNPVNGLVYVVNSSSAAGIPGNDVAVYNPAVAGVVPTGRPLDFAFGTTGGNGTGLLQTPLGIAFDKTGNVYVSSFGVGATPYEAIYEYSAAGAFIREIAFFNTATGAGDPFLFAPVGLAIDGQNNLFVALNNTNQIEVFNLNTPGSDLTGSIFAQTGFLNGPSFLVVTSAVPEPSSIVMLGLGLVVLFGVGLVRHRRKALAVA
jgi:DNA-binding beta-propeller fold protein YncE